MAENIMNINDQTLISMLLGSYIEKRQKDELKTLIPEMNTEEKKELMTLINEANEVAANDPQYQAKLKALNEEYNKKMDNLVQDSEMKAIKQFEGLEQEGNMNELDALEAEINKMDEAPVVQATIKKTKSNAGKKFLLMLIALVILGALITVALTSL